MAKLGFASSNIILSDEEIPIPALVLVQDQKIKYIHKANEDKSLDQIIEENSEWEITNYGNLHISPGIIDLNVKVNGDWEGRTAASKQAAAGGVTFFLEDLNLYDLPIENTEEVYCDYGIMEVLDEDTVESITAVVKFGAYAVKTYLQKPSAHVSVLRNLEKALQNSVKAKTTLFVDCNVAEPRMLEAWSPLRFKPVQDRLNASQLEDVGTFAGAYPVDTHDSGDEETDLYGKPKSTQVTSDVVQQFKGVYIPDRSPLTQPEENHLKVLQKPVKSKSITEIQEEDEEEDKIKITEQEKEEIKDRLLGKTKVEKQIRNKAIPRGYLKKSRSLKSIHEELSRAIKESRNNIAVLAKAELSTYNKAGVTNYAGQSCESQSAMIRADTYSNDQIEALYPMPPKPPAAVKGPDLTQSASPIIPHRLSIANSNTSSAASGMKSRIQSRMKLLNIAHITVAKEEKKEQMPNEAVYNSYLANCPDHWEETGVALLSKSLDKVPKAKVHICNVSSVSVLDKIQQLKEKRISVTVETAPHFLYFLDHDIAPGDTRFKSYPPIRSSINSNLLWDWLKMQSIDSIASSHNPILPDLKFAEEKNFRKAVPGVSSLGFSLQAIWTKLKTHTMVKCRRYNHYLIRLFRWLSETPASILGISSSRGSIKVGRYADFWIWNPEARCDQVSYSKYPQQNIYTERYELLGKVQQTWVRGKLVFNDGEFFANGKRFKR